MPVEVIVCHDPYGRWLADMQAEVAARVAESARRVPPGDLVQGVAVTREAGELRQAASARARQLLLSVLTAAEAESYLRRGFAEIRGSAGGWWRIHRDGQAGNVDELDSPGGHRVASWCCHPPGGLPDADAHAAQVLLLVTDEPRFRAVGNRTPAAA